MKDFDQHPLGYFILGMIAGLAIAEFVIKVAGPKIVVVSEREPLTIDGQASYAVPAESNASGSNGNNSSREKSTS